MKNIIIYTHMPHFNLNDGGTVVQYLLSNILDKEYNQNVRIYPSSGIKTNNTIFSKFYDNDFPIDDNCVVIYCEGTIGNPLNAKYVVRWMLSRLGQNVPYEYLYTWSKNELVYYFNSEEKIANNPEKVGYIYKLLNVIYLEPNIQNYNQSDRDGTCFTIRKAHDIHKNLTYIHPPGSFEITRHHSQSDYIEIFNKYKYFISYDSITFLVVIAALCGCVSIVTKIDNLTKEEWINTTCVADYFKESDEKTLYGIAYGIEETELAEKTLHMAKEQWSKIIQFSKDKTIPNFLNDINNWESNKNTIKRNFIDEDFEKKSVLYKGNYWPIKDMKGECIRHDYANTNTTCYKLTHEYHDIPVKCSKFVKTHNVVIYAGAGPGIYVKKYSDIFDYVYTFEPDPLLFYCLNRNVRSPNVFKYQACLGNVHECVNVVNTCDTEHGHGGSYVNGAGLIPTLTIDNLNLEVCNLIHLNAEGYEYKALIGGIDTIKRCKPVIIISCYAPWLERYGTTIDKIVDLLKSLDYKLVNNIEGDNVYQPIDY